MKYLNKFAPPILLLLAVLCLELNVLPITVTLLALMCIVWGLIYWMLYSLDIVE